MRVPNDKRGLYTLHPPIPPHPSPGPCPFVIVRASMRRSGWVGWVESGEEGSRGGRGGGGWSGAEVSPIRRLGDEAMRPEAARCHPMPPEANRRHASRECGPSVDSTVRALVLSTPRAARHGHLSKTPGYPTAETTPGSITGFTHFGPSAIMNIQLYQGPNVISG